MPPRPPPTGQDNAAPEPGAARVGNDPNSGELDSSFGSPEPGAGNATTR